MWCACTLLCGMFQIKSLKGLAGFIITCQELGKCEYVASVVSQSIKQDIFLFHILNERNQKENNQGNNLITKLKSPQWLYSDFDFIIFFWSSCQRKTLHNAVAKTISLINLPMSLSSAKI